MLSVNLLTCWLCDFIIHYIFSSVCGFPSRYLLRLTNQDPKLWTSFFSITLQIYVCSHSFSKSEQNWFSLYYPSRDVSMKKYLYATENTCRYFQYSLEVIPYFIYSNFFVVNTDYFVYWSLFHERLSTIATSMSREPLAVHCMIYVNCCVTFSWKE